MHVRSGKGVVKLQDVVKLPALTLVARVAVGKTVGYWLSCSWWRVVGRTVRNLGQHPEQRSGDPDRARVAQCGTRPALVIHFGRALGAQGKVMRGAQVCVHPQLTIDERRDRLDGQVLSGTELPRGPEGRIVLGGKLCGKPRERASEPMSSVGHHLLLSQPPLMSNVA